MAFSLRHLVDKCQGIAQTGAARSVKAVVMHASVTVVDELLTRVIDPRVCAPKRISGCWAWRIESEPITNAHSGRVTRSKGQMRVTSFHGRGTRPRHAAGSTRLLVRLPAHGS